MAGETSAENDGLDRLFYELASESRLDILKALQAKNYRMQELARKLDLTDTEAFRQLQRLSESQLIQKLPEGAYAITEYGKLIMRFSESFEFAFKFKQTLLTRNIWRIPDQFINRLGELSQVQLGTDAVEMMNNAAQLFEAAEKYIWLIGQKPLGFLDVKAAEILQKGVTIKLVFDEGSRKFFEKIPDVKDHFEKRVVPTVPAVLLMSEKFAGLSVLSIDGRSDSAVFYGNDAKFLKWASDLFLYYWEQGKHCYPV